MSYTCCLPKVNKAETGRNIRRLRKSRHMTVEQLAEILELESPRAIYKWQSGQCLPTADNLLAMSILFQVHIDEILIPEIKKEPREDEHSRDSFLLYCRDSAA